LFPEKKGGAKFERYDLLLDRSYRWVSRAGTGECGVDEWQKDEEQKLKDVEPKAQKNIS
jgi:hypothetical protein